MTKLSALFSFIALVMLSSCDPGVTYHKVIENQSDYDMVLYVYPKPVERWHFEYQFDSITIYHHSEVAIAEYSSIGQNSQFEGCDTKTDSIVTSIIGADSLRLNLNLVDSTLWTYKRIRQLARDAGECECRIVITNADIE